MTDEPLFEDCVVTEGLAAVTNPLPTNAELLDFAPDTTPTLDVAGLPAPKDTTADAVAPLPS